MPTRAIRAPRRKASRPAARVPITVVIPTLNEAHQIGAAVRAVSWADDVIVIDGGSSDSTPALAAEAGARVLAVHKQTIGAQRNAGITEAKHPWVLALDADERVTPALRDEIEAAIRAPRHPVYAIRFRSYFLGRELKHGAYAGDWHVRLFPREHRYSQSRVHERLQHSVDVGRLRAPINHIPFRDFAHYVAKVVRYARWGAEDLRLRGKPVGAVDLAARPVWRFTRDYFLFSGFLDGLPGFLVAAFAGVGTLLKYSYRITDQRRG